MDKNAQKTAHRARRRGRIRARLSGTATRPRLAVFRSNRALYAQIIDDERGMTLAAGDSRGEQGTTSRARAEALGGTLASRAREKGITEVVFDRGGFKYQGTIAAFAARAREAGLVF